MNESSCHSKSLSAFTAVRDLDIGLSNRYVMVSHCLNLHFFDDIWCGESFHMLICHLCLFSGEVFLKVFVPFFNEVVCYC